MVALDGERPRRGAEEIEEVEASGMVGRRGRRRGRWRRAEGLGFGS